MLEKEVRMPHQMTALLLCMAVLLSGSETHKTAAAKPPGAPLQLERTIPLPNIDGRLGHPVIDIQHQRLFVPAPAAGSVEVIDLKAGRVVKSIQGLQRPQSAAWHPESSRLFVTTRQDAGLSIYDSQLNLIRKVTLSATPDAVGVLPRGKQVLVAAGNTVAIFDLNGQQLGSIRLDGPPSSFLVAPSGQFLWINVPTSKTVVSADLVSRVQARSFAATAETYVVNSEGKVSGSSYSSGANYAVAFDERGRRLLVATRRPSKLLAMDSDSGNIRDTRQTINDPEDVWFDPATRHVFITGNDDVIDVVVQVDPDHYDPVARIPSSPGARTSLLVPEQGRFYVAAPKDGGKPAAVLVYSVAK